MGGNKKVYDFGNTTKTNSKCIMDIYAIYCNYKNMIFLYKIENILKRYARFTSLSKLAYWECIFF